MLLTTENLARFKGGQLEIQNDSEDYVYCGEIESVEVADESVRVKFVWLAKGKDGFPPDEWVKDDRLDYAASTKIYSASDLGDGRITMQSPITHETVVFFPPGRSRLDPGRVEGLTLPA